MRNNAKGETVRGKILGLSIIVLAAGRDGGHAGEARPAAHDWPRWRGIRGDGVWRGVRLPARLDEKSIDRRWSVTVGGGYSGIAVAGGRILTMDRASKTTSMERVLCLDRESGRTLWIHEHAADYGDMDHANGPRATPTVDNTVVHTLGALGHLACLDLASGSTIWEVNTLEAHHAKLPTWGHAASPVVVGDAVVVQAGGRPGGTVMAFHRRTGKELWRASEDRPGYSTPITLPAPTSLRAPPGGLLAVWTADTVLGIEALAGTIVWQVPFKTSNYDVAIASPVFADGRLFVSGYWDGARVFEVAGAGPPKVIWENRRVPSCLMSTPLSRAEHLYTLDRREGLLCIEWKTGKVVWKDDHQVTSKSRNPHASMVWAGNDDRAIILNAAGELIMAQLAPSGYQERGRVQIIGSTWAHPAFSGQDVFARSDTKLVCVRLK